MWSAGCVIAEIFTRTPLFNGIDPLNQLLQIAYCIGRPEGCRSRAVTFEPLRNATPAGIVASAGGPHTPAEKLFWIPPATHAHTPPPDATAFPVAQAAPAALSRVEIARGQRRRWPLSISSADFSSSATNRLNVHQALAHEFLAEYRQPHRIPRRPGRYNPTAGFFTNQPQAGAGGVQRGGIVRGAAKLLCMALVLPPRQQRSYEGPSVPHAARWLADAGLRPKL